MSINTITSVLLETTIVKILNGNNDLVIRCVFLDYITQNNNMTEEIHQSLKLGRTKISFDVADVEQSSQKSPCVEMQ